MMAQDVFHGISGWDALAKGEIHAAFPLAKPVNCLTYVSGESICTYDTNADISKALCAYGEREARSKLQKPVIDHVIFSDPATIVFWKDKTKTIVKCSDEDLPSNDTAILSAFAIKVLGKKAFNTMMKTGLGTPKTYHWTDICKVRFYEFDKEANDKLYSLTKLIDNDFHVYGALPLFKLRSYCDVYSLLPSVIARPKFDRKNPKGYCLAWTNRSDIGIARSYDKEKHQRYRHIYIRRSPESWKTPSNGGDEK